MTPAEVETYESAYKNGAMWAKRWKDHFRGTPNEEADLNRKLIHFRNIWIEHCLETGRIGFEDGWYDTMRGLV
jgi:hypothetical protein